MTCIRRKWADLTINCLGDSTTWGDNGMGAGGHEHSWPARLAEILGAGLVRNYGVKGSRIGVKDDRSDSFIERWEAMEADADVVLVFGGVNDFNREVPLGEPGSTDVRTFYGALDTLARGLIATYPEADIVFMTPCKSAGVPAKSLPPCTEPNGLGLTEAAYAKAVRVVADRYGLPVIDLFASSGISPFAPEHRARYMPDGLHYTAAGYERLARRIAAGLSALVDAR